MKSVNRKRLSVNASPLDNMSFSLSGLDLMAPAITATAFSRIMQRARSNTSIPLLNV